MKHFRLFSLIAITALAISSCQKEVDFPPGQNPGTGGPGSGNPSGSNSIIGNYDFIKIYGHTYAKVAVNDGGDLAESVTVSDYYTKDNVGTVKITATDFVSIGLGYNIDTIVNVKSYINGSLFDDSDLPLVISSPPTNVTNSYTKITSDSIVLNGTFGGTGTGQVINPNQAGCKISLAGRYTYTYVKFQG